MSEIFDDVLKNTKHHANNVSNDVNRPTPDPHKFLKRIAMALGKS